MAGQIDKDNTYGKIEIYTWKDRDIHMERQRYTYGQIDSQIYMKLILHGQSQSPG